MSVHRDALQSCKIDGEWIQKLILHLTCANNSFLQGPALKKWISSSLILKFVRPDSHTGLILSFGWILACKARAVLEFADWCCLSLDLFKKWLLAVLDQQSVRFRKLWVNCTLSKKTTQMRVSRADPA
jgi:hypothetical protein